MGLFIWVVIVMVILQFRWKTENERDWTELSLANELLSENRSSSTV